jgi:hypothetical protein
MQVCNTVIWVTVQVTAEASAPLAGTSPVKLLWRDEQDTQGNKIGW